MQRKKKEAPVIDADLESRGAGETEIQPPAVEVWDTDTGNMLGDFSTQAEADEAIERIAPHADDADSIVSISVPTDSTEVEPADEKEALLQLLTSKQVSVTSLTEDGGRGLRLYLGKPSMSTFENMLRRSTHGVVIEADPRREGVSVRWEK